VRAVGEADGPRGPADLLHGDAVVHVAEPHPAVLLRRGEAVEVEVPHEPPQVHAVGEAVGGVDRRGVRRDGLLREPVHALLELLLRLVEEEGGRGEEPRRAAARGRAAEDRREPPLHRRAWLGREREAERSKAWYINQPLPGFIKGLMQLLAWGMTTPPSRRAGLGVGEKASFPTGCAGAVASGC
jgi:hypothetical protein